MEVEKPKGKASREEVAELAIRAFSRCSKNGTEREASLPTVGRIYSAFEAVGEGGNHRTVILRMLHCASYRSATKGSVMDIEILKEFVFLSKGLNVTKASRELNMAQSTLSSHIIKLERDLGCSLVERDGSPRLTLAGREFLEVASEIVCLYDGFKERGVVHRGREDAVITVWAPQRREGFVIALLDAVIGFKGKYPQAIVDVQDTHGGDTLDELRKGVLDCGYYCNAVADPSLEEDFQLVPLLDEEFIIWMDKDSPLRDCDSLTPCDLEGYQLPVPVGMGTHSVHLQTMYEELFSLYGAKANVKPRYCRSVDDFFLSKINRDDLIILNRGSQIIEAMNEANGKVMGRFNPPIYSTGYLVFRSEDNSDMVECFKSHVLAFYEEAKISSLSNEAFKD